MLFIALTLSLTTNAKRRLGIADSIYAHAALMNIIRNTDPLLGRELHDLQRHKHVTITILANQAKTCVLRLTFLGKNSPLLVQIIVSTLSRTKYLRLGSVNCIVENIELENTPITRVSTWSDFLETPYSHHLRFDFISPTAITKRDDEGHRIMSLFPTPIDVFAGLARRWRALEGPSLPTDLEDFIKMGGCVVSKYELHTVEVRMTERTQIGFVGHVIYSCRKQSIEHISALNALSSLAFFSGIGYQTARGMGATITSTVN